MTKLKYIFLSLIIGSATQAMELDLQLAIAARDGNLMEIERLIQAGANVNEDGLRERITRDWATPLIWAVVAKKESAVRLLLKHHAEVNKSGYWDKTPLHWAVQIGYVPLVRCLIEAGADPNKKNYYERTPLMDAAWNRNPEIVQFLIESRANLYEKDCWGRTALMSAARVNEETCCELIIDRLMQLPSDAQLKKAYTLLLCLKQKGCPEELCSMIWRCMPKVIAQENREFPLDSVACWSIKNIKNPTVKKKLFEQYWPGMVSEAEQEEDWCTIL